LLGCAVSMIGVVWFCFVVGLFCLGGGEQDSILRITMESNPLRIHSLPSNNKPKQDRHQTMATPSCWHQLSLNRVTTTHLLGQVFSMRATFYGQL
jgi:hypothetical protein